MEPMDSSLLDQILSFIKFHPEITVIGAFTLIQIAPIKINPWSWLAALIHKFLFGSLEKQLDSISRKVDRLEAQAEEDKVVQARTHILRFADELYHQQQHSKEYFDDVLAAVDEYEKYCQEHPGFKNSRTVLSTQRIKDTYDTLAAEHRFL